MRVLGRAPLEPWLIGVAAGIAFIVALVALRAGMRASFDASVREQSLGFIYAFSYWQYLFALGAQFAAGIVAAARTRELRLVYALAAAFTAGVVAVVGIELVISAASCLEVLSFRADPTCRWLGEADAAWGNFKLIVPMGALAALAGGLLVVGVQAVLRRRDAPVPAEAQ